MIDNTTAGFRISKEQERVWAQQQSGMSFLAQCVVLIEGPLHPSILRESLDNVVSRYEILRTVYHRQPGVILPFQIILDSSELLWDAVDLSGIDEAAQQIEIKAIAQKVEDFNLVRGPILQASLAVLSPLKHALILSMPALSSDHRSLRNLVGEVGRAYAAAFSARQPDSDVMQYVDIVQWQTDLLESDDSRACRDFWRDYSRRLDLPSFASVTLPLERKDDGPGFLHSVSSSEIGSTNLRRLESICSRESITVSDFLLACWIVLLGRLTGDPEVALGCDLDGRKFEELEQALGLFAKFVPLQMHVDPALSFSSLLRKTTEALVELNQWQEGFSWSHTGSSSSSDVLPALPLTFEYVETRDTQLYHDVSLTIVQQYVCRERSKLGLCAVRSTDKLTLEFHYDAARLGQNSVELISGYFQTLLEGAVERPEVSIGQLPLLPQSLRNKLLIEWNQTAAVYPKQQCIHQLFEAQAAHTPDRPALRFNEKILSYKELNEQASQLAHYLRTLGAGPGTLVGLCLNRSADLMVALLAILKAGAAYISLNADTPKTRLAQQLAAALVLVTEQSLLEKMPELACETICFDSRKDLWTNLPRTNPVVLTTPEDLVYVLYTSGSTGVPKGAAVQHRSLVNYACYIAQRLHLEQYPEGLHFATVSTIAADLGNTCIYPSLISGGCLHLISYDVATNAESLARYNTLYPMDVLKIVPSHLEALLHPSDGKRILPRRYLITGGEALSPQLVERIMACDPSCQLLNHYGPTETTVGSLTLLVSEFDWQKTPLSSIPIGRPIANTQVYILDAQKQPVPLGAIGELYIAGDGVAAGYLNDPERTAERFIPSFFAGTEAARMYRTGDLVRYLPDGNIEFLGRADDQIKIRGFRVELGEIEAVLNAHAGVKQAVVLAREDKTGEKRLLGYVVLRPEHHTSTEELNAYLKDQLHDYMVPSALVLLPELPLTANGKIDRQALPEPELVQTRAFVAPKTPTEEVVAGIWAEVLRLNQVGSQDNFFDLGGHSLLATQVISRIRRTLNVDLPLRTLFESPTVAGLARYVEDSRRDPALTQVPPITKASRTQDLPLSFSQQRLWVLDQMEPGNPLYNIPRRLRMHGALDSNALTRALNEVVRRHESQRTTFAVRKGKPIQIVAPAMLLDVPSHNLAGLPEETRIADARRISNEEALIPFDLTKGPLLRATLLQLAQDDHILLLTMHHIVSDAWSAGVFFQEFSVFYEAFTKGQQPEMPELDIQYADYAAWQRQWFQGDVLEQQLAYWREHLRGAPPLLELPTDRPRAKVQSFQGAYESVAFSAEMSNALRRLGQEEGTTLFMTLLAGFQTLLSRYSGQEQIVVGTDAANRNTTDTERMIGFFINLLPLRTDLSGNPTFRELLGRVREVALGAYAHYEMPFDKIVEELQPERSLSHNPLVQVLLVMQNIPQQRRELAGLTLGPFELPITRSKFDLAVFVVDGKDGLVSHWLYSTDLFDRSTILRMADHFKTLLVSALDQPDARLRALEMLSQEEKQQRDQDKKQQKQLNIDKLMTSKPKSINLPHDGEPV